MSSFERFSIASFIVIFGCLSFLFNAVLSSPQPAVVHANGQYEPIVEVVEVDMDALFPNEYIFIADKPDGNTLEHYENNLNYLREELYSSFRNSSEVVSFIYYDIGTGYTLSYNENTEVATSSSIKAQMAVYIMNLVSQGRANLEKKLTYTADLYNTGSGLIKNQAIGTEYTIAKLLENMIIHSDNIAYLMLLREFNHKNIQAYWFDLGATTTYRAGPLWGTINAHDGLLYMRSLYRFYREDEEYGERLMDLFKAARFRYIHFSPKRDLEIAHKSGSTVNSTNDLSIIFDKHPFIFIVLTRKNGEFNNTPFFVKVTNDVYAFHQYFWENIAYRYLP